MKRIKAIVILLLGAAAAVLFALSSQKVVLDSAAEYTMDPNGALYLLSSDSTLTKVSADGRLEWTLTLPTESEDGHNVRYGQIASDRSGGLYITSQEYRRQVNAAGESEEIILVERIEAYNGDGVRQDPVLTVDKTALSQYSTESYILKIQAHGDSLLAICRNEGQYEIVQAEPYADQTPAVLASFRLETPNEEMQDYAALSDGTLVYTTKSGDLMAVSPGGEPYSLLPLIGEQSLPGRLSADETDSVYLTELRSGAFYSIDVAGGTFSRLYSATTVIDEENGISFGQVRGAAAAGDGEFCAVSIDTAQPYWVRFDADGQGTCMAQVRRGWNLMLAAGTVAVFVGTAAVLALLLWVLTRLGRRSMLTGRIILHFLPVLLLVLAALGTAVLYVGTAERRDRWNDSLAAAARTAAGLLSQSAQQNVGVLTGENGRQALSELMDAAAVQAQSVSGVQDVGLILYALQNDEYYGLYATSQRDAFYSAGFMAPLDSEMPADTVQAITDCAQLGGSVELYHNGSRYTGYFQPIQTDSGEIVALVEARSEAAPALSNGYTLAFAVCVAGGAAAVIVFLWLLYVLVRAFRPLQELGRCIAEIGAGNWSVKAKITSKDELAEIGSSFNQMTERLNQYISNMVLLNNEYIKFVPRELFQLMGKTKVTDVHLYDKSVRSISLLYVNFRAEGAALDSGTYFDLMNEQFDRIFDLVEKNRGIIERFDGSGMIALFPWQVRDALNTAIALKELMEKDKSAVSIKMLISADEMLVGVAGNQKRQTITAISDTLMDVYTLSSLMDELGTRYIITRNAVNRLGDDYYFNCREIGSGTSGRETLFEFLDGMDTYEKKLHLVTRDEFESGVHAFQNGQYQQARRHFVNVLQTNEKDKVAMYYLLLCDQKCHSED